MVTGAARLLPGSRGRETQFRTPSPDWGGV